jgi:hypothetical protein
MMEADCPTLTATIYIAGDYSTARKVCREYCWSVGLCVTVEPTTYIYTGGEEAGVRIGLINYPKYPTEAKPFIGRATNLANLLREELCQWSWTIVTPEKTYWSDLRADGGRI